MKTNKDGFTMVELSLAMVFISLLALAVVLITVNTISSYKKGLIMSQVNTTGSEIVDDIRTAIQNSSTNSVENECGAKYEDSSSSDTDRKRCQNDGGRYLVYVARYASVKPTSADEASNMPVYGAICTGAYSYIWNSGYLFSKEATVSSVSKAALDAAGKEYVDFRLLKVSDEKRAICSQKIADGYPASGTDPNISNDFVISADNMGDEEPVELIGKDSDLAIYDLSMLAPARSSDGSSLYYSGSFILGTVQGGPNIKATSSCKEPGVANSNFDYCAINKFNFAAQATGV